MLQLPGLAALALELEAQLGALHLDVRVAQRGQAVAVVAARVVVVADADQRGLQQVHDGGQHLLARQAATRHVLRDALADGRQRPRELHHVLVLRAVAHLAETRVVAVLLAAARVAPGGLQVAVGRGQIQTSVQAGGMASLRMRSQRGLVLDARRHWACDSVKPSPFDWREMPRSFVADVAQPGRLDRAGNVADSAGVGIHVAECFSGRCRRDAASTCRTSPRPGVPSRRACTWTGSGPATVRAAHRLARARQADRLDDRSASGGSLRGQATCDLRPMLPAHRLPAC